MYKDPKKIKEANRKSYLRNRDRVLKRGAERRKKYPITPEQAKNYKLKSLYGITIEDYYILLEEQGYMCAICKDNKKLVVDHCHDTGKVRGLLCHQCNASLGMAKDDIEILKKAIKYLNQWKKI